VTDAAARQDLVAFARALGDPTRLGLVLLLAEQSEGGALCVHALAHRLGVSQPAVSQHLAVLRDLGLLHAERSGARTHYTLDRARWATYRTLLDGLLPGGS
jgi:ArsR family transcriptional regulator